MHQNNLQALIGRAASDMMKRQSQPPPEGKVDSGENDGLLFLGNPHETVPRALLLDRSLGAVDKLAWQIIKLLSNPDGATAFPSYDQLQPLLGSGIGRDASRKTVARVIAVLRLTRWLTLGLKARNDMNGRIIGNVYVLHDEPLNPDESMMIDSSYVEYVVKCCSHNNTLVSSVAKNVREEMARSGVLVRTTRMDIVDRRARNIMSTNDEDNSAQFPMETKEYPPSFHRKLGQSSTETKENSPSSPWKLSLKSASYTPVPYGNSATTVVCSNTNTVCKTTAQAQVERKLVWSYPLEFTHQQREAVELLFTGLSFETCQSIIDETAGRMAAEKVKSPMAFIHGLAQRAQSGQFNISGFGQGIADRRRNEVVPSPSLTSTAITTTSRATSQEEKPMLHAPYDAETERIRAEVRRSVGLKR